MTPIETPDQIRWKELILPCIAGALGGLIGFMFGVLLGVSMQDKPYQLYRACIENHLVPECEALRPKDLP